MARMPETDWLGEHGSVNMLRYDIVCLHTIAGNPPAHAAHFSTWADGRIGQSRDTRFQSGANYQGNHRIIAIENDDTGPEFGDWGFDPRRVPAYTDAQVESLARILAWCHSTHGIPLVRCPDSRPGSRGIAYHRQGIDGNYIAGGYSYGGRVIGGEVWTKSPGKSCPGDKRIAQHDLVIKRARQLVGLEKTPVKNLILARQQGGPAVWVGDGIARRHVADERELQGLQHWIAHMGGDPTIREFADLRVLGADVAEIATPRVEVDLDYTRFVADVVAQLGPQLRAKLATLWVPSE